MDELSMVRRLLAEAPPPPDVVADGRERLLGSLAAPAPRNRPRRRTAALSLMAAAAAGAVVVTLLSPGAGTSPPAGGPPVTGFTARSVLLAAAVHAQSEPTTGTYWHIRSLTSTTLSKRFGHGADRYALERLSVREEWAKRDGQAWSGIRVWVRPADEAAWRRDGAPSKWCSGETDTEPPEPICLHTAPGTASLSKDYFPFEVAEGTELTFAQLQRLPQDADALRTWLMRITRHDLDPSASAGIVDFNVKQILADLLVYPPVPPGVRAAAYRALAGMPGVTSLGPTRDKLGRDGVGIEIAEGQGLMLVGGGAGPATATRARKLARTLIVDPRTSHVLADETRIGHQADPATDTLITAAGWTDEKPRRPALP